MKIPADVQARYREFGADHPAFGVLLALTKTPSFEFNQVKLLNFNGKNLDDDTLKKILRHSFTNLETILLGGTRITDGGLAFLVGAVPHLKALALNGTRITAKGIRCLKEMKDLTHLNLRDCTDITDNCLDILATMPQLKRIELRGCPKPRLSSFVSLRYTLPECKITF